MFLEAARCKQTILSIHSFRKTGSRHRRGRGQPEHTANSCCIIISSCSVTQPSCNRSYVEISRNLTLTALSVSDDGHTLVYWVKVHCCYNTTAKMISVYSQFITILCFILLHHSALFQFLCKSLYTGHTFWTFDVEKYYLFIVVVALLFKVLQCLVIKIICRSLFVYLIHSTYHLSSFKQCCHTQFKSSIKLYQIYPSLVQAQMVNWLHLSISQLVYEPVSL